MPNACRVLNLKTTLTKADLMDISAFMYNSEREKKEKNKRG